MIRDEKQLRDGKHLITQHEFKEFLHKRKAEGKPVGVACNSHRCPLAEFFFDKFVYGPKKGRRDVRGLRVEVMYQAFRGPVAYLDINWRSPRSYYVGRVKMYNRRVYYRLPKWANDFVKCIDDRKEGQIAEDRNVTWIEALDALVEVTR